MEDYYADTAKGSFTIENKTDFKIKFATGAVNHDIDAGFTYRYAHVLDIQNFVNEPVEHVRSVREPRHLGLPRIRSRCRRRRFPLQRGLQSSQYGDFRARYADIFVGF